MLINLFENIFQFVRDYCELQRIGMRLAASLVQFKLRSTTSVTGIANVNEMLAIIFLDHITSMTHTH